MDIKGMLMLIIMGASVCATAQTNFRNASFEGRPADATSPRSWRSCAAGSTPDILPGPWNVGLPPQEGNSYVGLITRSDGSVEDIGQSLSQPLTRGECYTLKIWLARSKDYAGYNLPVRLRLWGGDESCAKKELLQESATIEHEHWVEYSFSFTPEKADVHFLLLEAHYAAGFYFHYNGNILLDFCSPIVPCTRA